MPSTRERSRASPSRSACSVGLAIGDVEHELDRGAAVQHPAGEQPPPARAVLADVLLLEGGALAGRLQLLQDAQGLRHPLRRGELVPAQPARFQVLAGEAGHAEEGRVGVRDPAFGVEEDHPHRPDLGDAAEPLLAPAQPRLAVAQVPGRAQAVHRGRDEVGVGAEEGGVAVREPARLAAVDLQEAERRLALRADDDDVGHRLDPVLDQEGRVAEPRLLRDVGGDHRLPRLQGIAFRGVVRSLGARLADHARLPAHARADEQGLAVLLQLHDLGEVGAEGLPNEAAGLGQDPVQVVGGERQFPEPGQNRLLPEQLPVVAFLFAQAAPPCGAVRPFGGSARPRGRSGRPPVGPMVLVRSAPGNANEGPPFRRGPRLRTPGRSRCLDGTGRRRQGLRSTLLNEPKRKPSTMPQALCSRPLAAQAGSAAEVHVASQGGCGTDGGSRLQLAVPVPSADIRAAPALDPGRKGQDREFRSVAPRDSVGRRGGPVGTDHGVHAGHARAAARPRPGRGGPAALNRVAREPQ